MEYKFRAFDETSNLPVEHISERMYSWDNLNKLDKEGLIPLMDILRGEESDITPMQYIGKKDKNGKEIYVGDIITDKYGSIGTIVCHEETASFRIDYGGGDIHFFDGQEKDIWIIGNIYENANLLQGVA